MAKISLIVPVWGAERTIKRCIDSALSGGVEKLELILVDDGSLDHSGEICDRAAQEDSRIRVFHRENAGTAASRNFGIEKASGDYLCFMDSDDYLEDGALAKMLTAAEQAAAEITLFGLIIDVEGGSSYAVSDGSYTVTKKNKNEKFPALKDKCLLDSCCNKLYRADFVKQSGIRMPEGELFEDTDFNFRLWDKAESIAVFDQSYYHYLQRAPGSITKHFDPKKLDWLKNRVALMRSVTEGLDGFCSYYYVKYVLSVLCDSYLALPSRERKALIKQEVTDPDFLRSAKQAQGIGKAGRLLVSVAKSGSPLLTRGLLWTSYLLKYKLRKLFFKVKRV